MERVNEMRSEEFTLFQEFLEEKTGLHFDHSKMESLKASILQRMQINQLENFEQYYRFLTYHPEGKKELRALLSLITINETSFFRQKEQFSVLEEEILPQLIRKKEQKGNFFLDIWSAGCASGEEPYTVALILKEFFPYLKNWEIEILGTDVDMESLKQAKKGIYRKNSLRFTEPKYQKKYFTEVDVYYYLNEEIKKMVNFVYHNLAEESYPSSPHGKWDIIFCRNVLIYFKPEKIEKIFDHFYRHLNDNGYLLLGYAESIGRFSQFAVIHRGNTFYYEKEVGKGVITPKEVVTSKQTHLSRVAQEIIPPVLSLQVSKEEPRKKVITEVVSLREEEVGEFYQEIFHLLDGGQFALALEKINKLLVRDKLLPQVYYLRGFIKDKLNHLEEAIIEFKRAIYLDKNFLMAHFNLAEVYAREGKKKDALREYKNVLRCLENGNIEEPIPFSGGFSKKALAETCQRNIERLR